MLKQKNSRKHDEIEQKLVELKSIVFKDLHPHEFYSISGKEAPEDSQIAYDILQVEESSCF